MDNLIKKYCPSYDFASYEDLKKNFAINVPDDFNFGFDIVDGWAETEPEKQALVWTDDTGVMKFYTFADIKAESNKAANMLRSYGIKKGDVVLLILKQRPEVWLSIVALNKIGAVVIPASFQLTRHDLVYRLNAAEAKMLITVDDEYTVNNVKASLPECPSVKNWLTVGETDVNGAGSYRAEINKFPDIYGRPQGVDGLKASDDMLIYFSSGTTGMPKMVLHDNSSPLGQIVTAKYWQRVRENTVHMTQTDSGWAKFAWGKIYGQWICGAAVGAYDTEKFDIPATLAAIKRIKPATLCLTATIYRILIKEDITKGDFAFVKHATMAGEPLNPEVFNKFKEKTGLSLYEGFGQSESSVFIANFLDIDVRPGSMGKPAPVYDMEILDENLHRCEDGIVGSICVRGVYEKHPVGLFREYWKDPEVMKKSFKGGIYNTGDTAWRDADGYYWFVGRNDDVIKCSGYRIGPFEVESALMEHPAVLECAVTAYPDEIRGNVVKATIVLAAGYNPGDELKKELQNHVKSSTAPYKYPRIIDFAGALPKTSSGKIKRVEIRAEDMKKINGQ
ncbi:MAG: AMP-binding protein [Oscillospiraceae bacterium]|nr:AMP-binding protein [Oscillospiraceae bacterium]